MSYLVRFASTTRDRDLAFELRRAVFETEQNVPRPLDRDMYDLDAAHVVAYDASGACVGTGRLVRVDSRTGQIGRMATAASQRQTGVGGAVLEALEHMANLRGLSELTVNAQLPAERFYANRGYARDGGIFEDQGVPHVLMRKLLLRR